MDRDRATEAFYESIWPHRADVLRFARFLTRDVTLADDVAQEALLKAFKAVDALEQGANVRSWLLKIVRNTWLDRVRHEAHRRESSLEQLAIEPAADEEVSTWNGQGEDLGQLLEAFSDAQVIEALLELPEEMRWTLLLVDVEGLSVSDAGEIMSVPEGTVKSRCHRARSLLRSMLLPLARERNE